MILYVFFIVSSFRKSFYNKSITGVLYQVLVGSQVIGRYREYIEVTLHRSAFRYTAFPGPEIRGAGQFTKADKVGAALSFVEELASALIQDVIKGQFA